MLVEVQGACDVPAAVLQLLHPNQEGHPDACEQVRLVRWHAGPSHEGCQVGAAQAVDTALNREDLRVRQAPRADRGLRVVPEESGQSLGDLDPPPPADLLCRRAHGLPLVRLPSVEQDGDEVVHAREVVVEGPGRDAEPAAELTEGQRAVPALLEDVECRVKVVLTRHRPVPYRRAGARVPGSSTVRGRAHESSGSRDVECRERQASQPEGGRPIGPSEHPRRQPDREDIEVR